MIVRAQLARPQLAGIVATPEERSAAHARMWVILAAVLILAIALHGAHER